MGTVLFFWIGFSIVVAVAASARGRTGILWFLLSLLISPLIALLLVLFMELKNVPSAAPPPSIPDAAFEPDSVYAGIPYRLSPDGSIEAVIQGARMWFSDFKNLRRSLEDQCCHRCLRRLIEIGLKAKRELASPAVPGISVPGVEEPVKPYERDDSLLIFQPETLVRWHKTGFRCCWRWKRN